MFRFVGFVIALMFITAADYLSRWERRAIH